MPIVIGTLGTVSKHLQRMWISGNTRDHCITPESWFVGNSIDPKNNPRHLRLIGDSLMVWGIRPPIGVRHAHNNSNDDNKH